MRSRPIRTRISHLVTILSLVTLLVPSGVCLAQEDHKTLKNEIIEGYGHDSYVIGKGDVLDIMTWKEPDFTEPTVLVRNDGRISFPLLGDILVSGLTPVQVQKNIEAGLKDFVSSPLVTVTVVQPYSQKFYILGEVENTGEYELRKDLTVLQAFAIAGGFTQWASKKEIILLRQEDGMKPIARVDDESTDDKEGGIWFRYDDRDIKHRIVRINYERIVKGKNPEQNIRVKANDTIIVP